MIDKNEVQCIAGLARIGLDEKDVEKYQKDFSSILDYFKKLEELDTENVEPIGHITGMQDVFKQDNIDELKDEDLEAILSNAPEIKDGYVKVKSVL